MALVTGLAGGMHPHALAIVAGMAMREVIAAVHVIADLTLDLGEVVYDYLAKPARDGGDSVSGI